jgi:hypothetical protein
MQTMSLAISLAVGQTMGESLNFTPTVGSAAHLPSVAPFLASYFVCHPGLKWFCRVGRFSIYQ